MRAASSVLGVFFVSAVSFPAHAEESVVVTASRTEQSLAEVGQALSVIDAQAITERQSITVLDLLRSVPGVTVSSNGGLGTTSTVFIRGAESDHTVALIDGVKLNDPSSPGGGFDFGNLLVGNIERIEVLRGSQSVLWGSQAIGGVVNLITREPTDELSANVRAEYGWRDTRQLVANVSRRFGRLSASLGAGDLRTDGISSFSEERGGVERDAFRHYGANAKFRLDVTDAISFDLRGWYANGKVGIDGFPPPTFDFADTFEYSRSREVVGYSGVNVALLDGRWRNRLGATYTEIRRENIDPDAFVPSTFDGTGRNSRFEYQGTLDVVDGLRTVFGLETEKSRFDTSSFGGPVARAETRLNSGYVELISKPFTGLTATAGVRRDDHDEYGGNTSAGASATFTPNDGETILRVSYSEGFKAPTLFQLRSEYGNLLLSPERAKGGDFGVTQRFLSGAVELGVTFFRRDSRGLINFVSCVAPFTGICTDRPFGTFDNVAKARSEGVELSAFARPLEALRIQATYSYVDSENRSAGSPDFGKDLHRRPRNTGSLIVDYAWPRGFETGITLTHVGSRFDDPANASKLESHQLVDLRLGWHVTDNILLQGRIENLLDERYETVLRYGTPGRAAYAGVRLSY